jgi:hypothetical protein
MEKKMEKKMNNYNIYYHTQLSLNINDNIN